MKQKTLFQTLIVVSMTVFFSCTNNELQEDLSGEVLQNELQDNIVGEVHRVEAQLPSFIDEIAGTRSQINVDENDNDDISYSWAIGDVLGIFPDEGDQVSFRLTESSLSADGTKATFDGGAWALKSGHDYSSYFPFSYDNSKQTSTLTAVPVDYTGQSISSWNDRTNAGRYDFNAAGPTSSTEGNLSFQFTRLGSLLRLKLVLPATTTYQTLTLSTTGDVIPVKGTVDLSVATMAYAPTDYASSISVNLNDLNGTEGQTVYVYMMLPPMTLKTQKKELTATLSYSNNKTKDYALCTSGTDSPNTPDFAANIIYLRDLVFLGHEFVDLGLPSGLKWATCNIGASAPEEYGDYFAWGETVAGKKSFDWSTYKWCNGTMSSLTKYSAKSGYGTVDNKTVLEADDDAATQIWGDTWRMPTIADFEELIAKTTTEWTQLNGVNGRLLTSKINGQTLFLPAAGDNNTLNKGIYGFYWSSTLVNSLPSEASYLSFGNGYIELNIYIRYYGFPVRPVCP